MSKSTSFATLGYDRAHRIPYAALQGLLVDYCNDDASGSDLVALTDSLYDTSGSNSEYDNMVSQRDDLIKSHGGKPSSERLFANALLATLNSATFNVSPGDFSTNRSIQDNVDYGYQMSPGGTSVELTPRSKLLHYVWSTYDREPPVPTSPGGTTVKSSQVSSKGGTF